MVNYTFNKDKCQAERRTGAQQKSWIWRQKLQHPYWHGQIHSL